MDLNPSFDFHSFVLGPSNESAVAAARAVANRPGSTHNPLVVCGASGQGKTHLLMALAQQAARRHKGLSARYMTMTEFAEAFDTAVAAGQQERFRRRLAELDMLLLDDVESLAERRDIQRELCDLQERMCAAHRQLVVTGVRRPDELAALDRRLVSCLASGLIVAMGPPDEQTRLTILERCAATLGESYGEGVLAAVAAHPVPSVRDVLGALARVVALAASHDASLTPAIVTQALGGKPDAPVAAAADDGSAPRHGTQEFEDFVGALRRMVANALHAERARTPPDVARATLAGIRSREKMVLEWPAEEGRLIEELT